MLREFIKNRTACIRIRIGDKVQCDDGRIGVLKAIEIAPNDTITGQLVCLLTVRMDNGTLSATSDKFTPVDGEQYLDI